MTSLKFRAAAAATRFALRYPRLTWWAAQRIAPFVTWFLRRFRQLRPSPEARMVAELTRELKQATAGSAIDWQDVHTLGELCIRQRDYAGAALHFQRITAAAVVDRELRRSAASWLGRALEYAGDTQGARAAYGNYLRDFPEISGFERQRLERRLADLGVLPRAVDTGTVDICAVNDRLPLATVTPADDRPSRISAGRRKS